MKNLIDIQYGVHARKMLENLYAYVAFGLYHVIFKKMILIVSGLAILLQISCFGVVRVPDDEGAPPRHRRHHEHRDHPPDPARHDDHDDHRSNDEHHDY